VSYKLDSNNYIVSNGLNGRPTFAAEAYISRFACCYIDLSLRAHGSKKQISLMMLIQNLIADLVRSAKNTPLLVVSVL